MSNTGCVIVEGYCIHCRRPDHLQASDDYKCPGSMTIQVSQTAIERWKMEPAVQDVLGVMEHCGPWEPGLWDDICEKCKRASGGLAVILDQRDQVQEGLEKALRLLESAVCEHCGRSLAHTPPLSANCPDSSHLNVANQITELKKLLPTK